MLTGVNTKEALQEQYSTVSDAQKNNPDGLLIIAEDLNQANLKTVLPKFYQLLG